MIDRKIGDIISGYRRQRKLSQIALAARLSEEGIDVSHKVISNWEKGISSPNAETFLEVCRVLEIPDPQEEYFGENPLNPLSLLNDEGKEKAEDYIGLLLESGRYRKILPPKPGGLSAVRQLFDFDEEALSAGPGELVDQVRHRVIEVPNPPRGADFTVRIHGDSMTPAFQDGQHVYIHRQPALDSGEIGAFFLNGKAYIKKLLTDEEGTYLLSLNPRYQPVPVSPESEFRIYGKVLGTLGEYRLIREEEE